LATALIVRNGRVEFASDRIPMASLRATNGVATVFEMSL
jgi:hypothetical protein